MEINLETLKKMVLLHLEKKGISVHAFAKINGLNQPTLFRFLTGENVPNVKTVNKILSGLDKTSKKRVVNL